MPASTPLRLSLALLLAAAMPAGAEVRPAVYARFGPLMDDSHWTVETGPLECRLSQDLARLGRASFVTTGTGLFALRLQLERRLGARRVALAAEPPPWKHDTGPRPVAELDLASSGNTLEIDGAPALRLFSELEAGMLARLSFPAADEAQGVTMRLSAVNFRPALAEFLHCRDGLLPYGFDDVRRTVLHFASDSTELSPDAIHALERIAAYSQADKRVLRIEVDSYSDARGRRRYNRMISKRRAKAVRTYLTDKGLPADRIRVTVFGERHPVQSNRTAEGRAQNRRVVVTLQR